MNQQLDLFDAHEDGKPARSGIYGRLTAGESFDCPVCGQFCKLYKRKINSQMAIFLIKLYRAGGGRRREWADVRNILQSAAGGKNSSDGTYLVHWGMIESGTREGGGAGFWRVTDAGIAFAEHLDDAPKHIYLFNNKFEGFSSERTDIVDSLGDRFNYHELMRSTPIPESRNE